MKQLYRIKITENINHKIIGNTYATMFDYSEPQSDIITTITDFSEIENIQFDYAGLYLEHTGFSNKPYIIDYYSGIKIKAKDFISYTKTIKYEPINYKMSFKELQEHLEVDDFIQYVFDHAQYPTETLLKQ